MLERVLEKAKAGSRQNTDVLINGNSIGPPIAQLYNRVKNPYAACTITESVTRKKTSVCARNNRKQNIKTRMSLIKLLNGGVYQ